MAKSKKSSATGSKNAKSYNKKSASSKLCDELEKASAGLRCLSSEGGNDFYHFFTLQQRSLREQGDKLSVLEFLSGFGVSDELIDEFKIPVDELIEEREFDGYFPSLDELAEASGVDKSDPELVAESKQYRKLERLLKKRLGDIKVFRVGKVDVRVYLAGFAKEGNIAGLVTTSIET